MFSLWAVPVHVYVTGRKVEKFLPSTGQSLLLLPTVQLLLAKIWTVPFSQRHSNIGKSKGSELCVK